MISHNMAPSTPRLIWLALLSLLSLSSLLIACDDEVTEESTAGVEAGVEAEAELTDEEVHDLTYLQEEEKLARDVYLYAAEVHQRGPFENISGSEQQHIDAVTNLVELFEIEGVLFDPTRGAFYDEELSGLYAELTARVDESYTEALFVGALIEDLDIEDIAQMMERTTNPQLLEVYGRLQCGSRNHLRSYVRQLEMQGESYSAQFLTQAQVDEILAGENEGCGG